MSDSRKSVVTLDFCAVSGAEEFLSWLKLAGITSVGLLMSLGIYPVGGLLDVGSADDFVDSFSRSGAFMMIVVIELHDTARNHSRKEEFDCAFCRKIVVNIYADEPEFCRTVHDIWIVENL